MSFVQWDIDEGLLNSPAITNRNLFAQKLALQSDSEIINQYAGLSPENIENEFSQIFEIVKNLNIELKGIGLELGAGVGVLSAVAINCWPKIKQCYALEIVPKVIELLQPRAVKYIAKERSDKIIGVLGSFDKMNVKDKFFDFCIEYASLHHSNDLFQTLSEVARVLKPGAPLIAIDRAHSNKISDTQLKFMLDVQYSLEWKLRNGYSSSALSRAENGEHEIRMREWLEIFESTGFEMIRSIQLRPIGWKAFKYKVILLLPFTLRRLLAIYPSRTRPDWTEIFWHIRGLLLGRYTSSGLFLPAPKEHTLFILRKRP